MLPRRRRRVQRGSGLLAITGDGLEAARVQFEQLIDVVVEFGAAEQ